MTAKSNYLENALINAVLRNTAYSSPATVYIGVSTADPTEDGSGLAEPSGNGYARVAVAFVAPTDGATDNSALISFAQATGSWGTLTHFAIFDAVSAGNMLYYGALGASKAIDTDDTLEFAIGDIDISEA